MAIRSFSQNIIIFFSVNHSQTILMVKFIIITVILGTPKYRLASETGKLVCRLISICTIIVTGIAGKHNVYHLLKFKSEQIL